MKSSDRTPVGYFHIVDSKGVDLGWLGYCESLGEAMLPALLHPGGAAEAERRAKDEPPAVLSSHNGDVYVPCSWLRKAMSDERDLMVVDMMKAAAEGARRSTQMDAKDDKTP